MHCRTKEEEEEEGRRRQEEERRRKKRRRRRKWRREGGEEGEGREGGGEEFPSSVLLPCSCQNAVYYLAARVTGDLSQHFCEFKVKNLNPRIAGQNEVGFNE
jgi:hypothetical protein